VEYVPAGSLPHLTAIPEGAIDVSTIAERWFAGETFGAGLRSFFLILEQRHVAEKKYGVRLTIV
jgi:hypothetical protein